MPTNKELLIAAQNEQLQAVANSRVAVLTGLAELKEFGGEDNYVASVSAIVKQYPDGISLTKIREVLPDAVVLKKAIKKLQDDGDIDVKDDGRSSILKPLTKSTPQSMEGQLDKGGDAGPDDETPTAASVKPQRSKEK